MEIKAANRIASLPVYAFKIVDDKVGELKESGADPIDFGVGDPSCPTPEVIRRACQRAIDDRSTTGYPSYIGSPELREAVAAWSKTRFGVDLDPADQISSTIGSKEGIFNFPNGFIDPGDVVIVPSPGYPPYSRGTWFAGGKTYFYPLRRENGFLPDLDAIPDDVARAAKIMWINYPNSPSGTCPNLDFYRRVWDWTRKNDIILASDEAYSEIYFGDTPPPTALQLGDEGIIAFNSLSKRSAMTGYRVGWVAGDRRIIGIFRKMKPNVDSGTPTFIQDAAVAALGDEKHVIQMREDYRAKRDILADAFEAIGLPRSVPEGTLYIWQQVPDGMTSMAFATRLMDPKIAIVTTPGSLIAEEVADGSNPGEGYVRFSLVPTIERVKEAAERIANLKL